MKVKSEEFATAQSFWTEISIIIIFFCGAQFTYHLYTPLSFGEGSGVRMGSGEAFVLTKKSQKTLGP